MDAGLALAAAFEEWRTNAPDLPGVTRANQGFGAWAAPEATIGEIAA